MKNTKDNIIEITPDAAEKAKALMEERDMKGYGIRIEIRYSQENASYTLELSDEYTDQDIVIESNGIDLYIDSKSSAAIEGSKIDWIKENGREGFKIIEPYNKEQNNEYDDSIEGRAKEFLDRNFPQIKGHGGKAQIEVLNRDTGYLKIKLDGACSNCGISNQTLKAIKRSLPGEVDGVNRVEVETGDEEHTEIEPPV